MPFDFDRTFQYHSPTGDQIKRYQELRAKAKEFVELIDRLCPESREKSLALTKVQESIMWANASIAINEL